VAPVSFHAGLALSCKPVPIPLPAAPASDPGRRAEKAVKCAGSFPGKTVSEKKGGR